MLQEALPEAVPSTHDITCLWCGADDGALCATEALANSKLQAPACSSKSQTCCLDQAAKAVWSRLIAPMEGGEEHQRAHAEARVARLPVRWEVHGA